MEGATALPGQEDSIDQPIAIDLSRKKRRKKLGATTPRPSKRKVVFGNRSIMGGRSKRR